MCGEGGHLAWLADHGAACCQGRCYLEGEEVEREVPGRYQASHAHWTATGVVGGTRLWYHGGTEGGGEGGGWGEEEEGRGGGRE